MFAIKWVAIFRMLTVNTKSLILSVVVIASGRCNKTNYRNTIVDLGTLLD